MSVDFWGSLPIPCLILGELACSPFRGQEVSAPGEGAGLVERLLLCDTEKDPQPPRVLIAVGWSSVTSDRYFWVPGGEEQGKVRPVRGPGSHPADPAWGRAEQKAARMALGPDQQRS